MIGSPSNELTIITFNINGIKSKQSFLFDYLLAKQKPDILCLQECKTTHLKFIERKLSKIGYSVIFQSSIQNDTDLNISGGNAIIYRSDFTVELITDKKCPSNVSVEFFSRILGVKLVDYGLDIYSIYLPAYNSKKFNCIENTERFQKSVKI